MSETQGKPVELKLYKAKEKIYPREIQGRFQWLRKFSVFILLGLFYLLPWLNWGDQQAVLFDLPARRFHIFGLNLWPQDFVYLSWLLIIAAFSLFFFTALAGRLWCGYACPQTVWTEVFIWLEQLAEGNRHKRMKLDAGPWTLEKWRRKISKQVLWIAFALWTGFTFVGFFTPIRELFGQVLAWNLGPWETFWLFFYSFATYGNAGFLREQVCLYMCPYARFQSAMFDKDTLIISYDTQRGEPRMRGKQRRAAENPGDCIDCTLCVQVCPTGIDIRDGLQYECIGCAACIDACDQVMEKNDMPKGLIRYTTEHAVRGRQTHILRPRIVIYALVLLGMLTLFSVSLLNRSTLDMNVIRDRNSFYRVVDADTIENVYTVKLLNKGGAPLTYTLQASGLDGLRVVIDADHRDALIPPGEILSVPVRVQARKSVANKMIHKITLQATGEGEKPVQTSERINFFGYNR